MSAVWTGRRIDGGDLHLDHVPLPTNAHIGRGPRVGYADALAADAGVVDGVGDGGDEFAVGVDLAAGACCALEGCVLVLGV